MLYQLKLAKTIKSKIIKTSVLFTPPPHADKAKIKYGAIDRPIVIATHTKKPKISNIIQSPLSSLSALS
jgi:hypothetical protein